MPLGSGSLADELERERKAHEATLMQLAALKEQVRAQCCFPSRCLRLSAVREYCRLEAVPLVGMLCVPTSFALQLDMSVSGCVAQ